MAILIDGYNLLNATGIFGHELGPSTLETSRRALLNFLATSIEPRQIEQTTVVFDAKQAPPGMPREVDHRGITVRFAAGYKDADTLIEHLIRLDTSPRRLTVVSSDHRIQRAARKRGATAIDSGQWYAKIVRTFQQTSSQSNPKPDAQLSASEVDWWIAEFGDVSIDEVERVEKLIPSQKDNVAGCVEQSDSEAQGNKPQQLLEDIGNPFPPGYAEGVIIEEDEC